ncbi:MAG: ferritin family protein [Bacteroidales bacterium]|nr:ferritin family protein [Bacteroidales bacterium]
MDTKSAVDILKQAIIMEHRGKALYQQVAQQTSNEDVRKIFNVMADEEQTHIDFLQKQLAHYSKQGTFDKNDLEQAPGHDAIANTILTDEMVKDISGSGFEAAAISAAIDMENKSVEVYSKRAAETNDPNEKELFTWLANWEKGHHKLLIDLNKQLTEQVWYDNNFWPF